MTEPIFRYDRRMIQKILILGDSHTCGHYGIHLDRLCRQTGASVQTWASCCSSPNWWFEHLPTHCGFFSKDEKGKTFRTPFGVYYPTPDIATLLKNFSPDLSIITTINFP